MPKQFRVVASIKPKGKGTIWLRCGTAWVYGAGEVKNGGRIDINLNSIPVNPLWDGTLVCFLDTTEEEQWATETTPS
jgi:hypothetical protein